MTDDSEFDDLSEEWADVPLTEDQILRLALQTAVSDLHELEKEILYLKDRRTHYEEPVSLEALEVLLKKTQEVIKTLS